MEHSEAELCTGVPNQFSYLKNRRKIVCNSKQHPQCGRVPKLWEGFLWHRPALVRLTWWIPRNCNLNPEIRVWLNQAPTINNISLTLRVFPSRLAASYKLTHVVTLLSMSSSTCGRPVWNFLCKRESAGPRVPLWETLVFLEDHCLYPDTCNAGSNQAPSGPTFLPERLPWVVKAYSFTSTLLFCPLQICLLHSSQHQHLGVS